MPFNRYFYPHPLNKDLVFTLSKEENKHLQKVLRKQPDDQIEIVNGMGSLATAIIQKDYSLRINTSKTETRRKKQAILIQAIGIQSHLEMIIEKGTELGVDQFWLFFSSNSPMKALSHNKQLRLDKITIAALKQCSRLFLPPIKIFSSKEEIPTTTMPPFLMDEKGLSISSLKKHTPLSSIAIVGPESGLSSEEIQFFTKERGAVPLKLHDNTLRSETAAIITSYFLFKISRDDLLF